MSVWLSKSIRRRPHGRWALRKSPPWQHNAHRNQRAVNLRFVHVANSRLRVARLRVQHVRDSAVRHEVFVHRHLKVLYGAVCAKDFAQVVDIDILGELFDDDFGAARFVRRRA